MVLSRYRNNVTLALDRIGKRASVLRHSGGSTNGYGKNEGGEWTEVGKWSCWRSFNYRSDQPSQEHTGGGEYDTETPVMLLPAQADVIDGDRIYYDGKEYEVTADPVEYPTHYECSTRKVGTL